ncbi:hypothetical protein G9H71_00505 [Motilibacter sp. E257]|uniref:Uncharacterized protein n=1 Tax=Motilibacter deserti TaxID=2714956 RepID=A0ABX0GQ56_9ACTN|nr:hypothetical protein [Motilibacter deserti]
MSGRGEDDQAERSPREAAWVTGSATWLMGLQLFGVRSDESEAVPPSTSGSARMAGCQWPGLA